MIYLLLAFSSMQFDDLTYDEQDHLNYGVRILKQNSSRQEPGADFNTTMPVTAFNALPRAIEQILHPGLKKNDFGESDTKAGRYITVFFGLILLIYAYQFGNTIAGKPAGTWAMLLFALDPNILAHSRLVTTDIYSTLSFIASLYHLYQWIVNKNKNHFYYFAIAIAIAQCCKINNVLLYPICFAIVAGYNFNSIRSQSFLRSLKQVVIFLVIQCIVINIAFLFYHTGGALNSYTFKSEFFQHLQNSWIGFIPLPIPQSFIDTFDLTQFERESFTGTAQNYLLGELQYKKGFWYYYLICWVVKTPLLTQLLIITTIASSLILKIKRRLLCWFFLFPSLILFLLLSSSSVQSGYRYMLPVLSLGLIAAALLISRLILNAKTVYQYILVFLIALPALLAFPNYLAYTSEWLQPKRNAYLYLADSNLDWGQRDKKIREVLEAHPDYIFEPADPVKGFVVVGINNLTGINHPEKFEWLRKRFRPIKTIEGCFLLYEVDRVP